MLMISLVLALLLPSVGNPVGACDDFVFKKLLEGPPRSEYHGRYVNLSYEYSVVIPRGLTAYDAPDPANHEGFGIAPAKPLPSHIFVRGEHNSLEYDTPRAAARRAVEYLRQDGKEIESETISKWHLGALDAARLQVVYTCRGSADRHILSSIMALSPDRGFLYQLEMYSPADRYERDRKVLDQIRKSWKTISRSRRRRHREH